MWTQNRLLVQEQSDLGPHFLLYMLLKHFSRREKQTTFVAIGALRVKSAVDETVDVCNLCDNFM